MVLKIIMKVRDLHLSRKNPFVISSFYVSGNNTADIQCPILSRPCRKAVHLDTACIIIQGNRHLHITYREIVQGDTYIGVACEIRNTYISIPSKRCYFRRGDVNIGIMTICKVFRGFSRKSGLPVYA